MKISTVLVTAATGTVGSALVSALSGRGVAVRAMTRDASRVVPGALTVAADLDDPASLTAALNGVDAAFLNSPSSPEAAEQQIRFADLAAKAGVARLVVLSQYAASADSPVRFLRWHAEVEAHVRGLDMEYTFLRPNLYLQSLLAFAAGIRDGGRFGAPIGDAAVSAIDTRDIAEAAAVALTESGHSGRTYTLTGPKAVTHVEIAAALSQATGRTIGFAEVPPEGFAAALSGFLPPWQVAGLLEDYAHYSRGEAAEVHDGVTVLTGRPARGLDEFAADHAAAFRA